MKHTIVHSGQHIPLCRQVASAPVSTEANRERFSAGGWWILLWAGIILSGLSARVVAQTSLSVETLLTPGETLSGGWIISSPRFSSNLTYPTVVDSNGVVVLNALRPFRGFNFDLHPDGRLGWFWSQGGVWEVLDSSLQASETIAFTDAEVDYHDFELLENGNVMLLGQKITSIDVSDSVPDPANPFRSVIDCLLQELAPDGTELWFWRASDHIPPTWCTHCNWNASLIDAYHHNAIQTLPGGDVLLCLRNMDAVMRIDRATGDIAWVCGGPFSNFEFTVNNSAFRHPHDAQLLEEETLILFDNGTGKTPLISRGVEYQLDFEAGTITQTQNWLHPDGNYASSQGSIQRLENGGTLIGWGTASSAAFNGGMITEYSDGCNMVGQIFFPQNHFSYRARKVPSGQFPAIQGCTDPEACDFDPEAVLLGDCTYPGQPCDDGDPCTVGDAIQSDCTCAGLLPPLGAPIGCSDPDAVNFDPCASPEVDDGSCQYAVTFRVDATAMGALPANMGIVLEGNELALNPGGFGTWYGDLVLANGVWTYHFSADGILDTIAREFNLAWPMEAPLEEVHACFGLPVAHCPGCTDPDDPAFSPFAGDDTRCGEGPWLGCTIPEADNYAADALFDDGTCTFTAGSDCPQDLDGDGVIGVADVLVILSYFGLICD